MSGTATVVPNFYQAPQGIPAAPGAAGILDANNAYQQQAASAQINPLDQMAKVQQIKGQQISNTSAQLQQNSDIATGRLYQQSMNPDGTLNQQKFVSALSLDPDASYGAPATYQQMISNGLVDQNTVEETLKNNLTHYQNATNILAPQLQINPQQYTDKDFQDAMNQGIAQGIVDPNTAAALLKALPPDGPQAYAYMKSILQGSQGKADTIGQIYGTVTTQDFGGVKENYQTPSPMSLQAGGAGPTGPATPNTLAPADANGLVPVKQSDGTTILEPRAAAAPVVNAQGGQTGGAAAPPVSQQSPQDQYALGPYAQGLTQDAAGATKSLLPIQQLENLLPQIKTGAGQGIRQDVAKLVLGLNGTQAQANAIAGGDVNAADEFMKYQILAAFPSAVGVGGGELTAGDRETLRQHLFSPTMTHQALQAILQRQDQIMQLPVIKNQMFSAWVNQGGKPSTFETGVWPKFLKKSGTEKLGLNSLLGGGDGAATPPQTTTAPAGAYTPAVGPDTGTSQPLPQSIAP
jgi:hypothetical protein